MLFLTASAGLCSIKGTCLWAAAWNTTWGRYSAISLVMDNWSVMSATSATIGVSGKVLRISASRKNSEFSAWSISTRISGSSAAIWRVSSDPTEPAAPVTRIAILDRAPNCYPV